MKPGSFLLPVILALLITSIILSCNKNNSGKPSLTLESISTPVQPNDSMRALFKFSSGGALGSGTFYSIRTRLNQVPPTDSTSMDTIPLPIPAFSGNSGEFRLALPWNGYLSETAGQNDTLTFKFFVLTTGNVSSDTIGSPKIIILNP
jgi:hypothetical protein